MSHPAASIKSIFSGKVNLTDTEYDDSSARDSTSCSDSRQDHETPQGADRVLVNVERYDRELLGDPSFDPEKHGARDADSFSVSSKNLRIMMLQKGSDVSDLRSSSTNVSLASSGSDYQQAFAPDPDVAYTSDSSQHDGDLDAGDAISRPVSRNSTTLCLLTTATKDGIEGKRLHRHGPTAYFSNVIANMIQHQHQNPAVAHRVAADNAVFVAKPSTDADLPPEGASVKSGSDR